MILKKALCAFPLLFSPLFKHTFAALLDASNTPTTQYTPACRASLTIHACRTIERMCRPISGRPILPSHSQHTQVKQDQPSSPAHWLGAAFDQHLQNIDLDKLLDFAGLGVRLSSLFRYNSDLLQNHLQQTSNTSCTSRPLSEAEQRSPRARLPTTRQPASTLTWKTTTCSPRRLVAQDFSIWAVNHAAAPYAGEEPRRGISTPQGPQGA